MYKHVLAATLRLNEPITLRWIEPLHSAGRHAGLLLEAKRSTLAPLIFNSNGSQGCLSTSLQRQARSEGWRAAKRHLTASGSDVLLTLRGTQNVPMPTRIMAVRTAVSLESRSSGSPMPANRKPRRGAETVGVAKRQGWAAGARQTARQCQQAIEIT
jgi:hypothetical protein